jgi:hypothetical protein
MPVLYLKGFQFPGIVDIRVTVFVTPVVEGLP